MKKYISTLSIMALCLFSKAQTGTISPIETNEYCSNTVIEFTVNLPGPYQGFSTLGGVQVTQTPYAFNATNTNFKFKCLFTDANQAKTIRINYTNGSTYKDFVFKKIKSLLYTNPVNCGVITPNVGATLNAAICQIANYTISFPRIKWFTAFETTPLCFGEIADYEFKIPAGWKIGNTLHQEITGFKPLI
jgi:hypothetical protein